jgi:hypothetical protein
VKHPYEDALIMDGDREMVDESVAEALAAGVSKEEIAAVMRSQRKDEFWVPLVSSALSALARERQGLPRRSIRALLLDDDVT